jgi:hypothetical protein
MLCSPHRWPCRPVLCLKRGDWRTLECGVLREGTLTIVQWPYTMLNPQEPFLHPALPRYTYESLTALLADGWEVD